MYAGTAKHHAQGVGKQRHRKPFQMSSSLKADLCSAMSKNENSLHYLKRKIFVSIFYELSLFLL